MTPTPTEDQLELLKKALANKMRENLQLCAVLGADDDDDPIRLAQDVMAAKEVAVLRVAELTGALEHIKAEAEDIGSAENIVHRIHELATFALHQPDINPDVRDDPDFDEVEVPK